MLLEEDLQRLEDIRFFAVFAQKKRVFTNILHEVSKAFHGINPEKGSLRSYYKELIIEMLHDNEQRKAIFRYKGIGWPQDRQQLYIEAVAEYLIINSGIFEY